MPEELGVVSGITVGVCELLTVWVDTAGIIMVPSGPVGDGDGDGVAVVSVGEGEAVGATVVGEMSGEGDAAATTTVVSAAKAVAEGVAACVGWLSAEEGGVYCTTVHPPKASSKVSATAANTSFFDFLMTSLSALLFVANIVFISSII